jgi:hypothetical protein
MIPRSNLYNSRWKYDENRATNKRYRGPCYGRSNVTMRKQRSAIIAGITVAVTIALYAANVPSGSPDQARAYYRGLATTLGFRDPLLSSHPPSMT